MILKGLKDKFKHNSGLKYLRQEVAQPRLRPEGRSGIQAVGILADLDAFSDVEALFGLTEVLGIHPNAVKVLGYKSFYDKNSPYATPVFSDKDLGWKGAVENSYVLEFLGREYDLLINYFQGDNLLMQLVSLQARARIRAGLHGVDPAYNDLIFSCDISDFGMFTSELKKYLNVLKEIA